MAMLQDTVVPFVFDALPVRGAVIQLSDAWRRLLVGHTYAAPVRDVLGHAAAATPLIAKSLKAGSSVTLQLSGDGPMSMLVMQCTSELDFRGLAVVAGDARGLGFAELAAKARCAITVDNDRAERPYQGIVAVGGDSLAASLEDYFLRSAQIPSHLTLLSSPSMCGGILLQQMPDDRGRHTDLGDDWRRLGLLAGTLGIGDLAGGVGPPLIGKLFPGDDVRVFAGQGARFHCRCSRRRAADVLRLLGAAQCELAGQDEERIVVTCEYCGRRQRFDAVDIAQLFAEPGTQQSDALH